MSFCTYPLARLKELQAVYQKYEEHVAANPGKNIFQVDFSLAEELGVNLSDLEKALNQATLGFGVEESIENQWIKVGIFIGSFSEAERYRIRIISKRQEEYLNQFNQGLINSDELFLNSFESIRYVSEELYTRYVTSMAESGIVNLECLQYIKEWLMKDSSTD